MIESDVTEGEDMTLCQLLFEHYVKTVCGGNRSMVARQLGIARRRVNSISNDLENGAGLAKTLIRLLCEYRRSRLDINSIVDLYLIMEDADKYRNCMGIRQLKDMSKDWKEKANVSVVITEDLFSCLEWLAGHISGICCQDGMCPGEYGEDCACWWLIGLMDVIREMDIDLKQE